MNNAIDSEQKKEVVKMDGWSKVLKLAQEYGWKAIEDKQFDAENENINQDSLENKYYDGWQRIEWEDAVNLKKALYKALPNLQGTKRELIEREIDSLDKLVEYWPFDDFTVLVK